MQLSRDAESPVTSLGTNEGGFHMQTMKALKLCSAVTVCVVAGSPALGKGGPILIQGQADVVSRHIAYADLNLASPAAQRMLVRRVQDALGGLCMEANGGVEGTWLSRGMVADCSRNVWNAQAQPQITEAIQRAREIAATGKSSMAAAVLTISIPVDR